MCFAKSLFEEDERDRLLHMERGHAISEYEHNRMIHCDMAEHGPVTPDPTDDEEEEVEVEADAEADAFVGDAYFDLKRVHRRKGKAQHIWDVTGEHELIDEAGNNVLDNSRAGDMDAMFGIYHAGGIRQQAMIVPQSATIDGEYLANNAKVNCKGKGKWRTRKNAKAIAKCKKTRRGNRRKKCLTRQELDALKAKELVEYLELSRQLL